LSVAFGGRNKKRLNRVFDAIGFVYPDYCYPLRGQGIKRKIAASGKIAASAITVELKGKKMKVLTHRPRYIEPAVIPEFGEGTSSASKAKEIVPILQSTVEHSVVQKITTVGPAKAEDIKAKEPQAERVTKMPEILSPPGAAGLPKVQKTFAATPKRRRMANVLDAILETTKALSPAPAKKVTPTEAKSHAKTETRQAESEATQVQAETEAGPSVPTETEHATLEEKATEQIAPEKIETPAPEALIENVDYIFRHASRKKLSEGEILEARHYARKLKYPKGALVFNGNSEDYFLYCLPDNKEISICWEIGRSIGFPKLEDGLSILSKDDLADSLAYNNIKV
jgi:hypothetical protein